MNEFQLITLLTCTSKDLKSIQKKISNYLSQHVEIKHLKVVKHHDLLNDLKKESQTAHNLYKDL